MLVETPQQVPLEQAFFTFRAKASASSAPAGVFTPAALKEMLALYRSIVDHPRFEQFCLLSRPVPTAPLACEPPRSPLQLFYGTNTSRFRKTDFLAFDLPRFESMSSLVASLGIGPLLFAAIAGADALLDGCQSACARDNVTQCQLSAALSALPASAQLDDLPAGLTSLGGSGGGRSSNLLSADMIKTLGPCSPYRKLLRPAGFRRVWVARVLQLHLHLALLSVR